MAAVRFQQILGLRFFVGDVEQAIAQVRDKGGLVVVPSGPGLRTLAYCPVYREALLFADLAITDSGFMVLLWNLLHWPWISKLSGLKYLRALLQQPDFRRSGATFWVMPTRKSADRNLSWLRKQGIVVSEEDVYIAPFYKDAPADPELVKAIDGRRPRHVIICLGGGVQEPLGFYLKQNLKELPTIHCIGAAIGFLTGDQVRIPVWADTLGLGWLWRIVSNPKQFVPRYWEARHLAKLILRFGERLPVAQQEQPGRIT